MTTATTGSGVWSCTIHNMLSSDHHGFNSTSILPRPSSVFELDIETNITGGKIITKTSSEDLHKQIIQINARGDQIDHYLIAIVLPFNCENAVPINPHLK